MRTKISSRNKDATKEKIPLNQIIHKAALVRLLKAPKARLTLSSRKGQSISNTANFNRRANSVNPSVTSKAMVFLSDYFSNILLNHGL